MIAAYTGLSKQTVNTVIRALKESGYTAAKQTSSFPHKKEIRQFGAQTRDLAKRSRV
jgi:biotin operon repressor